MNATKKPSPVMLRNIILTVVLVGVIALIIYGLNKSSKSTEKPLIIQGQMEMQSSAIAAKVPGRISKIMVTEGDTVKAGQQLIEMDSPEITAKMNQALAARDMAQSQLDKAENGARPQEIGQAQAGWQANQAAADLAKSTYERVDRLYQEGLMARQKRDEAYTQYKANQDKADAARLQYELAKEGTRVEDKDAAKAQVAQVDGKIQEAQAAQDEANLKSPISGIVDDVIVNPGEVIGQGVPIMTLVDPNDQWVVLNVTENVLNQFSIGKEFVGKVPALSSPDQSYQMTFKVFNTAALSDFATWRATNTQDNLDVRTFEVKARPTKADPKIRSGMSVVVELNAAASNKRANVAN
ncbi:efflux RND transporter periplasmic adaptor subunit [Psychrobacter sp.]|uniref:HlyD family secretion protein n=1 Tax=Psychrobacter sp. TaxID=56811 RepID=UPI0025FEE7E9|nr:efflux RND transporter periplasmic adaptor subunit [Psychrobacter sp.]